MSSSNSKSSKKISDDKVDAIEMLSEDPEESEKSAEETAPKVNHYSAKNKKLVTKVSLFVGSLVLLGVVIFLFTVFDIWGKISERSNNASPILKFFGEDISPGTLRGEGDGRVNILLIGIGGKNHDGGQLADTIMVASIDPINNQLAMLSIPRDLRVPLNGGGFGKINAIHAYGENSSGKSGPQDLKNTVGEILDLPIHYYLRVDFEGFTRIVDELGGIDIDVPKEIYDANYPDEQMVDYAPFYIGVGNQHLDGATALKYARSRYSTSDFDRAGRQQQIIDAVREKALSVGVLANPAKVWSLVGILGDHVRMDMSAKEVSALVSIAKKLDTSKTASRVLDNSADGPLITSNAGGYYLVTRTGDWSEIRQIAHEIFKDPYIFRENAQIEILNGSGVDGRAGALRSELTNLGYNISNIDNTEEISETVIYDYSNKGAQFTVDFLKNRLGARVVSSNRPEGVSEDVTIQIIIGKNYNR